jgi:hypothetical protein
MKIEKNCLTLDLREIGLLAQPCVYKVIDNGEDVIYVGASRKGITRLLTNHHLYDILLTAKRIEVQFFNSSLESFRCENELIRELSPLHNQHGGGLRQERASAVAPIQFKGNGRDSAAVHAESPVGRAMSPNAYPKSAPEPLSDGRTGSVCDSTDPRWTPQSSSPTQSGATQSQAGAVYSQ